MKRLVYLAWNGLVFCALLTLSQNSLAYEIPDFNKTPGVLCNTSDPNFKDLEYPEQIARCDRNVSFQEKEEIAAEYGNISRDEWKNYEFDHLIPLCAGGSNDIHNLWPQPLSEAKDKDTLEVEICTGMRDGNLKQADAVQKVYDWFKQRAASTVEGQ